MNKSTIINYIKGNLSKKEKENFLKSLERDSDLANEYAKIKSEYVFDNLPNTPTFIKKRRIAPILSTITKIAAVLSIPLFGYFVYDSFFSLSSIEKSTNDYPQSNIVEVVKDMKTTTAPMLKYYSTAGVMGRVVLPDSSIVWLNNGSTIEFPAQFDSDVRKVVFSGEGYFQVRSNSEWPMTITTPTGISAIVRGTEFNLNCYKEDKFFKLTMINGNLSVYRELTNSIINVTDKEQVIINKGTIGPDSACKIYADVDYVTAWKKGILKFNNTQMSEVANRISRWYGCNVIIHSNIIQNYRFTGEFHSESLIQVLETIKLSSNVRFSIMNKDVVLF